MVSPPPSTPSRSEAEQIEQLQQKLEWAIGRSASSKNASLERSQAAAATSASDLIKVKEAMRFRGRRGRQVTLSGFPVELDEIERALLSCGGVVAAAAWVDSTKDGVGQILTSVRPTSEATRVESALLSPVARSLNHSAMRRHIFVVDQLPLTVNGKIDRSALSGMLTSRLPESCGERVVETKAHHND